MPIKHAYISAAGPLAQTIEQFRKAFPSNVSSETLKKLGLAPSNESFVINILKFLGLIGEDGTRKAETNAAFVKDDDEFPKAFEPFVRKAYADLFALHNEAAWELNKDKLVAFFRTSDESSELVGTRQAMTFQTLATIAGRRKGAKTASAPKSTTGTKAAKPPNPPVERKVGGGTSTNPGDAASGGPGSAGGAGTVGLTVRIEINLPAQGDQETYDRIFISLRKNLLHGQ